MKKNSIIITSLIIALGLGACKKETLTSPQQNTTPPPTAPLSSSQIVSNNNDFALDLYQQVVDEDKNQLLSPYSISTALAMTYAGTAGNTATQMQSVLGFGNNTNTFHTDFNQIKTDIETNINGATNNQVKVVNKIWRNNIFNFLPAFETTMTNTYNAPVVAANFNQPTLATQNINNWVAQETNQLIQDFLPKGFIKPNTATVLVNALYLSADWEEPFDTIRTSKQPFTTSNGSDSVDMMSNEIFCNKLRFTEDATAEVLELYLKDKKASVTIILPKNTTTSINTFVQNMTSTQLNGWLDNLAVPNTPNSKFRVHLPKFDFETKLSVKDPLLQLGMTDAFSSVADFSKMGNGALQISDIQHHTNVKFFESGIEAAAATAVGIFITSAPPIARTVNINRPFVILIREVETESILFLGHVQQP